MSRNVRALGWRDKSRPLPQDAGRTQASLDAEARVRASATTGLPSWVDDATDGDWVALDQRKTFESKGLGTLPDVEECRLAAKAYDEMGWPMSVMTGCDKNMATSTSCGMNLRQMAAVKYDSKVHRQQTEEKWELLDGRQRGQRQIRRVIDALKHSSEKILP